MNNWPVDDFENFQMDNQFELEMYLDDAFAKFHNGAITRSDHYILAHLYWRKWLQQQHGNPIDIPNMDIIKIGPWLRFETIHGLFNSLKEASQGNLELALIRNHSVYFDFGYTGLNWPYKDDVIFLSSTDTMTTVALHFQKGNEPYDWAYLTRFHSISEISGLNESNTWSAGQISWDDGLTLYKYFSL